MKKKINRWAHLENQLKKEEDAKKSLYQKINDLVYNYKTKYEEGFTTSEQQELLKEFPDINMDKYDNALTGITCSRYDDEGFVIYHCDVVTALLCGIENREITASEWD